MSNLLHSLKLPPKLAALGVVGVALCMLPLVQLLRFQALELAALRSAEAGIDPALSAMALQRGIVGHRDTARRWLAGDEAAAAERLTRQAAVDTGIGEVRAALGPMGPLHAQLEVQALQADWQQLVPQVAQRSITPPASDVAHRLLLEQAIQLLDLVAWSPGAADAAVVAAAGPLLTTLPRRTRALAEAGASAADWEAHWVDSRRQVATLRDALAQRRSTATATQALGLAAVAAGLLLAGGLALATRRSLRRLEVALDTAPHPASADDAPRPVDGSTSLREATREALEGLRAAPLTTPETAAGTKPSGPTQPAPLDGG